MSRAIANLKFGPISTDLAKPITVLPSCCEGHILLEMVLAHMGKLKAAINEDDTAEFLDIAARAEHVEQWFAAGGKHARFMSSKMLIKFASKIPSPIFNLLLEKPEAETSTPSELIEFLYARIAELAPGVYNPIELEAFKMVAMTCMADLEKACEQPSLFDPTEALLERKIVCPQCRAYFIGPTGKCSSAQCRGDGEEIEVVSGSEEEENEKKGEPKSEAEANQRFVVFKRWNVAVKSGFGAGGITTFNKNHPLFLERAGDFDEDMQDQFFVTMSHILQALADYPADSIEGNFETSAALYKVFRFTELHYQEATSAERALKLVLWYTSQGSRFGYDLHRFRQVWLIALELEKQGFEMHHESPNIFSDILLVLFFCVDGEKGEVDWEMAKIIHHKTVSPLIAAYLSTEPEQVRCMDNSSWKNVWAEDFKVPSTRVINAMHNGFQKWSYAGIFDFNGIYPFDYKVVTTKGTREKASVREDKPVTMNGVPVSRSSAGMQNLLFVYSCPITTERALIWDLQRDNDRLSKLAQKVATVMPPALQQRWDDYEADLEDGGSNAEPEEPEDEAEKPEEVPEEDQKEVDSYEPRSEVNSDLDKASDAAAQEATKAVNGAHDQDAHVEGVVEPFSLDGISALNRDSALQKLVAPGSQASEPSLPAPQETPAKGNLRTPKRKSTPGESASK